MLIKKVFLIITIIVFQIYTSFAQELDISKMQDNGTGPDGIMIFPQGMAMRCGISSHDGNDSDKIKECLDRLVYLTQYNVQGREDPSKIMTEILGQMNKIYMQTAMQSKSEAGDYEDKIDEETGNSAAVTIRDKQEQLVNLSAMGGRNIISLNQVYASVLFLQAMEDFYKYEFLNRKVDNQE